MMKWELGALEMLANNPTVPGAALKDAIGEIKRLKAQMLLTPGEHQEIMSYIRGDYHMNKIPKWLADLIIYGDIAMMNVEHLNIVIEDLKVERDWLKALTDNLFNQCLEALGQPAEFSLLQVPWQLKTMKAKIDGLLKSMTDADAIYSRIVEQQKDTIIGCQKNNDALRERIEFLQSEIIRLKPRWDGIPE
jgi:hypothetical protein